MQTPRHPRYEQAAYEQDTSKSQLWNEMSFIHVLRMIAAGIEEDFDLAEIWPEVDDNDGTSDFLMETDYDHFINCLRFASPAEAIWRLGGLEARQCGGDLDSAT